MDKIVGTRICSNMIFTKELSNEEIKEVILRLENKFAEIIKNDADVDLVSGRATFVRADENNKLIYDEID